MKKKPIKSDEVAHTIQYRAFNFSKIKIKFIFGPVKFNCNVLINEKRVDKPLK